MLGVYCRKSKHYDIHLGEPLESELYKKLD